MAMNGKVVRQIFPKRERAIGCKRVRVGGREKCIRELRTERKVGCGIDAVLRRKSGFAVSIGLVRGSLCNDRLLRKWMLAQPAKESGTAALPSLTKETAGLFHFLTEQEKQR